MKRNAPVFLLVVLAIFTNGSWVSGSQTPPAKPEDPAKNLVLVEKPEAPPEPLAPGFNAISARDSLAMLSFLASDLLEGRETGTRGFQLAAEYAASLLGLWHITPLGDIPPRSLGLAQLLSGQTSPPRPAEKSFFQEFAIQEITETSNRISLEVRTGGHARTLSFQPGQAYSGFSPSRAQTMSSPVVFAGYGISEKGIGYDDFKAVDVEGKIILILSGAPGRDNPESPFQRNQALKDKYFPRPPSGQNPFAPPAGRFNKISEIQKRRPAAILQVVSPGQDPAFFRRQLSPKSVVDEQPIIKKISHRMLLPGVPDPTVDSPIPLIAITHDMADGLLEVSGQTVDGLRKKIESTGKSASMEVSGTTLTIESTVKSRFIRGINVVGAVEGSDPVLKEEVVVVGAHLDHTGRWEDYVYNGADDNGSGSVGVLNLARAFSAGAQKPKRTVVFCLWCGEEKGVLGSRFFLQNPPLPKARIIAYLNMDMISRPF
ncbi:MAG: M28 family peptidase, partial [Candidatus Aminicenantes bacterium]|nr:M28 family peptidase [Candidatus Aminicenantes bacterium]